MPGSTARDRQSRSHSQANDRRQQDDEDRLHGLEPRGRERETGNRQAGVAVGEKIQRRPRLLVSAPEDRREDEEDHDRADPLPVVRGKPGRRRGGVRAPGGVVGGNTRETWGEALPSEPVLHDADRHADAGRRKPGVPVHALREVPRNDRAHERAAVDPHVEDREARRRAADRPASYSDPTSVLAFGFSSPVPITMRTRPA